MQFKVLVIYGGVSTEREISIASGRAVCEGLREAGYAVEAVDLTDLAMPLLRADVAFIALHGAWGEDGQLQKRLEELGLPYVGTAAAKMPLSYNKFDRTQNF